MRLEYQILTAIGLDLAIGDPRWFPHPVRLIGKLAAYLEAPTRGLFSERMAGIFTAMATLISTGVVTWTLWQGSKSINPIFGDITAILILWTTFAGRDLADHAFDVKKELEKPNIVSARKCLGKMVGRDTDQLDERELLRGVVESVAENTTDGVTAPLFYACFFGPVGAMVYKAASTLDSTFGYRNERYLKFGWASARIDDFAAFIPARLTAKLIVLAAGITGLNPLNAARILARDGRQHPSPNAGLAEAAMAGALGVQLGGLNYYLGEPSPKPIIGDPLSLLSRPHVTRAIRLMFVTSALAVAIFISMRLVLLRLIGAN